MSHEVQDVTHWSWELEKKLLSIFIKIQSGGKYQGWTKTAFEEAAELLNQHIQEQKLEVHHPIDAKEVSYRVQSLKDWYQEFGKDPKTMLTKRFRELNFSLRKLLKNLGNLSVPNTLAPPKRKMEAAASTSTLPPPYQAVVLIKFETDKVSYMMMKMTQMQQHTFAAATPDLWSVNAHNLFNELRISFGGAFVLQIFWSSFTSLDSWLK